MSYARLWWLGVSRPGQAFDAIREKPAPAWGFLIIVLFNIAISLTDLVRWLTDAPLVMDSWLTILPAERYLLAELFFLPILRVLVALLAAGVIHVFLRLARQPTDYDRQVNLGGMGYLVMMPVVLVTDWLLLATGRYDLAVYTHSAGMIWSLILAVVGLRRFFGLSTGYAVVGWALSQVLTLPFLSIFAR